MNARILGSLVFSSRVRETKPEHKFTFGRLRVGNPGRDPFGEAERPVMRPVQLLTEGDILITLGHKDQQDRLRTLAN